MADTTNTLAGCPCDRIEFPPQPEIPAGLAALPRQLAGFPEFRAAMLAHIPAHRLLDSDIVPTNQPRPLQDWRAREGDDLGVMLLEMWSYVLDVLAFYEERLANESYLQTAQREISLRRLVELIGYHPSPATAATVVLSLIADTGKGLISIPAGTGFRSGAFDTEKPQVFETTAPTSIDPALNRWKLAPIRDPAFDGIYLASNDAKTSVDDFVLLSWRRNTAIDTTVSIFESPGSPVALVDIDQSSRISISGSTVTLPGSEPILYGKGARVTEVDTIDALDGSSYRQIALEPDISPPAGTLLADMTLQKTALDVGVTAVNFLSGSIRVTLESQQSGINVNDIVLLARDDQSIPFRVLSTKHLHQEPFGEVPTSPDAVQPFTLVSRLELYPKPPTTWDDDPTRLRLHFNLVRVGALTRAAKDRVTLSDIASGVDFDGTVEPPQRDTQSQVQLRGADGNGAAVPGSVTITTAGNGNLLPEDGNKEFDTPLRVPIFAYGNLATATRGETVANEVIGGGDPSQAFQTFKLKKSPLTWLDDPSGFNGRRSTLSIRVNGILWSEVPSFYGQSSNDEVFIIRENEDHESLVTFGDGVTGSRLPRGVANVTATYRYGAGAAKPPANSITQLARSVFGLRQVVNPVAAAGGSDADNPDDLRRNAPTSSLLLGRAVSLPDFEALAREFGGVINAHATWTWDGRLQRAVVKIWFIGDGGSIEDALRSFLVGQSDPNVPLVATAAQAVEKSLLVDLIVDDTYNSDDVEQAVIAALLDHDSGLLALENIPIGCPLFRSQVLKQIHAVPGVVSVRALRFDGQEAPAGMLVDEGQYLDFAATLVVGNTASGDVLAY